MKTARNFAIIALVALALAVAPGGGSALNVAAVILAIGFAISIAALGFRLYRERRFTLDSLPDVDRFVLYASIAVGFLDWVAFPRFRALGAGGWVPFIGVLAIASGGIFWVYTRARRYD